MQNLWKKMKLQIDVVVILVLFLSVMTYLFELLLVLPLLYGNGCEKWKKNKHILAGTWILFNVLASYLKFVYSNSKVDIDVMPSDLPEDWLYCVKCKANCPPRSYHCPQCNVCVLVRDHHCVIGSNCVGYKNRRYFLLLNFYMWLALLYSNVLNMTFMCGLYRSMRYSSLLTMTFPMVALILGYADGDLILLAVFTSFCVVTFLYATSVLLFHLQNTLKGRTTHEMKKKLGFEYDLGLFKNLEQTFGLNWSVGWICPLIPSPLPGDGLIFIDKKLLSHCRKKL